VEGDLYLLQQFGPSLDRQFGEESVRDALIQGMLKIRAKKGGIK